jgi:alpha-2-macroglobulin
MKLRALVPGLLALATLSTAVFAAPTVEFVESPTITPARTVELRFGDEMISGEQLKAGQAPAPMETVPAIDGAWTWQSTRSGVFTPSEPWPLATTVVIKLRGDLKTAAGQPLPADWQHALQMPAFALQAWTNTTYRGSEDASALPGFGFVFNADVAAAEAEPLMRFTDKSGAVIPAKAEATTEKRPGLSWFNQWQTGDRSLLTWTERFKLNAMPRGARKNQVFVSPSKPLPPGTAWRLVIDAGIPAEGTTLKTLNTIEVPVGNVLPFKVSEIDPLNILNDGRRLRVSFNKTVSDKLDAKELSRWVSITPAPSNLVGKVSGASIEFTGDFSIGQPYRVAVEPDLPAQEPFTLGEGTIKTVAFRPIEPRVYFEAFDTHQMKAGQRQFHLRAVNVPKIRVMAKLFSGTAIPAALRGYEGYFESPKDNQEESYSRVDPSKLGGQVIWQQDIEGTAAVDEEREIPLDWSKILGGEKRAGVVLLTAEQVQPPAGIKQRPGAQAIVQLTDIGAVWKRAPGETFFHTFSLKTGRALAGAKIQLIGRKGAKLGSGTTDENGIARLPDVADTHWFSVEKDGDSHVIELTAGRNYIDLARVDVQFSDDGEGEGGGENIRSFLFTERGVYRPGDTVHFKGILRDWRAGHSRLAAGMKARVDVVDAREKTFLTKNVTLSALGSFSEDIALPQGVLGTYRAELHIGSGEDDKVLGTHEFLVEEYKPNAFEIVIGEGPKTPGPAHLALPVAAKYYMGKSLSKAQLAWSIDAHDEDFAPEGFDDYEFGDAIHDHELRDFLGRESHFSTQGKVALDDKGGATVEADVPLNTKSPQPRAVRVLAEVTDIDQQTVSQSRSFTLDSSDFYLGLRDFRALLHEKEPLPLEVIAVRTDGTPMPEPVSVEATLKRIDWQNNRVENENNATEYRNEPKFEVIGKRSLNTATPAKDGDRWTFGAVKLDEPLVPDKPGAYLLELASKDAAGRQVVTTTTFQVYGVGATAWDYRNPFQVELIPEKDDYTTGDTAKILVKTPIAGDALVTIEREKVMRSFTVKLEGNAPIVEVPLLPGDAPNVFVSVMLLRGADQSPRKFKAPEYRIGYCELKVSRPDSELAVYVRPGAKAYQPGDTVSVTGEVLDDQGRPVRDAEITLFAVDEGVLSLTGYETPDPLTFFNEPRPLTVSTALTLPSLLNENPEERDFANKGYLVGGGGDDANRVRKNFLACAYWHATLRSDPAGKFASTFTAPDSLTRYRIMAVVQTKNDQFGNAESAFEVNKPVMLEPSLPRFANVGDRIALRAVLHNTTDLDGEAEVRVKFDGTVKAAENFRKIALGAKATVAIDFPVEFAETGTARWQWNVVFTGGGATYRDAVQSTLKVGWPSPMLRHVKTMRVEGAVPNLLDGTDPQLLEGTGVVRVSLTNTRAIELQEAVEQLLHYPYGCVEQTTSSTLPWLTLRSLKDRLPALQRSNADIASAIDKGVKRLLSMQTESGGLAYWPGETRPMLWGSAYGSLALTLAIQQGHSVPDEDYGRLMKWMSEQMRGTADVKTIQDLRERCLAAYALARAGRAEPAYHELLFQRRAALTVEDRALLALAIIESKGPASMTTELLANATAESDDSWFWSPSRSLALQLLCWTKHDIKSARTEAIAQQLFDARRGGHWWTTQGNAWALLATSDFLAQTERGSRAVTAGLKWGADSSNVVLGAKPESKTQNFPVGEKTPMSLTPAKGGTLYAQVTVEAYPPIGDQPAQDRGYALRRTYSKIEDDGTLSDAAGLRVGDRVLVTLDLDVPRRAGYLAIEDPLPAVFEAVNPSFKTQQTRAGEKVGVEWLSDYRELREDRALFFANSVGPGHYTLRYLARVAAAGQATAPCAKVEEMYAPDRHGLTASTKVETKPLIQ